MAMYNVVFTKKNRGIFRHFFFSVLLFSWLLYWSHYLRVPHLPHYYLKEYIIWTDMSVCSVIIPNGMYTIVLAFQQQKIEEKSTIISRVIFTIFLTVFTSNVLSYFTIPVMCKCRLCIATKCYMLYFFL